MSPGSGIIPPSFLGRIYIERFFNFIENMNTQVEQINEMTVIMDSNATEILKYIDEARKILKSFSYTNDELVTKYSTKIDTKLGEDLEQHLTVFRKELCIVVDNHVELQETYPRLKAEILKILSVKDFFCGARSRLQFLQLCDYNNLERYKQVAQSAIELAMSKLHFHVQTSDAVCEFIRESNSIENVKELLEELSKELSLEELN